MKEAKDAYGIIRASSTEARPARAWDASGNNGSSTWAQRFSKNSVTVWYKKREPRLGKILKPREGASGIFEWT